MLQIGSTLREARMRAQIDISEVEVKTKIRAKYLRALENEEWGLLPGNTYVKSFLRTYAEFLGLDASAIVNAYKLQVPETGLEHDYLPVTPLNSSPRRMSNRPILSKGNIAVGLLGGFIVVMFILGIINKNDSAPSKAEPKSKVSAHAKHAPTKAAVAEETKTKPIYLALKPTAPTWICLIDREDKVLIPGEVVPAGEIKTFKAKGFRVALGSKSIELKVNDKFQTLPKAEDNIAAYAITDNGIRAVSANHRPNCKQSNGGSAAGEPNGADIPGTTESTGNSSTTASGPVQ